MAIFHCPIKIIQRSKGKSAVAAAAYRSGTKITNEWDGLPHDYTRKGGIIRTNTSPCGGSTKSTKASAASLTG